MTQQSMHPLAEQYLSELRRLTSNLERGQRDELLDDVRAHIEAGLDEGHSESDVRNLLEALGTPEAVAGALDAPLPQRASVGRIISIAAVVLLVIGAALWSVLMSSQLFTTSGEPQMSAPATSAGEPSVNTTSGVPVLIAAGDVQLRPVLSTAAGDGHQCAATTAAAASTGSEATACSADGAILYTLGPAAVTGAQVFQIQASADANPKQSLVMIQLTPAGKAAMKKLTSELAGKPAPTSQMAIVVRGEVQSAPTVMEPMDSGILQIALPISLVQAQVLVDGLLARGGSEALPACPDASLATPADLIPEWRAAVTSYLDKRGFKVVTWSPQATVLDLSVWKVGTYSCRESGAIVTYHGYVPADATAAVRVGVEIRKMGQSSTQDAGLGLAQMPDGWRVVNVEVVPGFTGA